MNRHSIHDIYATLVNNFIQNYFILLKPQLSALKIKSISMCRTAVINVFETTCPLILHAYATIRLFNVGMPIKCTF